MAYFPRMHHIAALQQSPRVTVKIECNTRKIHRTDYLQQEDLLQRYQERIEKLSQQDRVSKFCTAGFLTTVDVGQYLMTKDTEEFSQFTDSVACREYTLPRDENSSEPKGWIRGNTKIGPALKVTTCYLQGDFGVEIRIESVNKDKSHSWVRISHGLNKLVTELSNKEDDNKEQETSEMQFEEFVLKFELECSCVTNCDNVVWWLCSMLCCVCGSVLVHRVCVCMYVSVGCVCERSQMCWCTTHTLNTRHTHLTHHTHHTHPHGVKGCVICCIVQRCGKRQQTRNTTTHHHHHHKHITTQHDTHTQHSMTHKGRKEGVRTRPKTGGFQRRGENTGHQTSTDC